MLDIYSVAADKKKRNCILAIEAAVLASIYMLAVYFACGMWFETNDDVFISEVLSGKVTGTAEYHITYVSVLLTLPISGLYSCFPNVPWWGIVLFAVLFIVAFSCIYPILKHTRNLFQNILSIGISMSILLVGIHNYGQVQYTGCAILLAFAGYFVLLCEDNHKKGIILFVFFEFTSCIIRDKSMILAQPAGFSLVAVYVVAHAFFEDRGKLKNAITRMVICIVLVIASIGVVSGARVLAYANDEWSEYKKSDDVRVYLTDYEGKIEYSQLESVLKKYNISEEEYEQFLNFRVWYPNYKFSTELYDELIPVLKELRSQPRDYSILVASLTLLYSASQFWHLHQFTLALFFVALVLAFIFRNKKCLAATCTGFWGYLIGIVFFAMRNRYVLRVMMPYYVGVALLLSGLILMMLFEAENKKTESENLRRYLVFAAILAGYVIFALCVGRVQFAYIRRQNNVVNTIEKTTMTEITNYCNANPDMTFIVDNSYFRGISTEIFETEYYKPVNYIYSGSWFETAQSMVTHGEEYLDADNFCCLVYEAQSWKGLDAIEFWEHESGHTATLYDKFMMSTGATMWVYNFSK